jgi:hypothetical protein
MIGEPGERWQELCAPAAKEHDSKKPLAITEEINRLLKERQERLKRTSAAE